MKPAEVLVVGGGFAGFWAALAARRVLGPDRAVTLVSEGPVLQLRPRLYEERPQDLGIPLQPLLQRCGIDFVQARVQSLSLADDRVHLADGRALGFGRLVLACGSAMPRPPVPGADQAFSIDTQADAMAFDARLQVLARQAGAPTIAVLGAGFTGIELVLELRDRLAAHGGAARADRARLLLVDRSAEVGPELGPGPRSAIEAALDDARIERLLGARVEGIEAGRLRLQGQPPIEVDAVALASGLRAAPLACQVPGDHDALGRVVVDAALRAPQADRVFVGGDAAAADTGGGRLALQSCQHALRMGRFAGENAARDLLGAAWLRYAHPRYVTCLDLGRAGAVYTEGWERRVRATGAEAKAIKQRINRHVIVPPALAGAEELLELSRIAEMPDAA